MVLNEDFAVTAIGYGAGGRGLLTDEAYNRRFAISTGNPSRALVESLLARGVRFSMCQNTMKANSWTKADLLSGVNMVPAGIGALVDMQKRGWRTSRRKGATRRVSREAVSRPRFFCEPSLFACRCRSLATANPTWKDVGYAGGGRQ